MSTTRIKRIKRIKHQIIATSIISISMFVTGCGKRRPPQPPRVFSQSSYELTGKQRGDSVILSLDGNVTRSNQPRNPKQALIYRLSESPSDPLFLSEENYASRAVLIGTVDISSASQPNKGKLFYNDRLSLVNSPTRLRYAIRLVADDERRTAFSNFFLIEPTSQIAKPPVSLMLTLEVDEINLTWRYGKEEKPVNFIGYNVYRVSSDESNALAMNGDEPKLLTPTPIAGMIFTDKNFVFGEEYGYFIRAVSSGANGETVESLDSDLAKITPIDKTPPSAPESVTIAAAPNRLSLFFAPNAESDLAGYDIYRTTDQNIPLERWQKLNDARLKSTTFQDLQVESGKRYYYYLKAIDTAGNVSTPSVIVSEIAP